MKKFVGFTTNGEYSVGCTGQTVYLYDKDNNEIGRFKDIIYAYTPMISPDGTLLVVKSTDGRLAVYSLESFSLIKKFRFSKVNGAQDDGFCFSPDGKYFINLERHRDSLHSVVSVYNTADFSLADRIIIGEDMMFGHIEYDKDTDKYYVLGFMRDSNLVINHGFVAEYREGQICNTTVISQDEYWFYSSYKSLEMLGFTEKQYDWTYFTCSLEELRKMDCTLAKLHTRYTAE